MNPAVLSLAALVVAIVASCFTPINAGFISLALAFLIGYFVAGMKVAAITAGFPAGLFLTLAGTTLLFSQAGVNGTLEKIARLSVHLARGNKGLIPPIFFLLAVALGASGVGGISAAALLAPLAMSIAAEMGINSFLMAMMVANGANAGTFSPVAPTGLIARELMARIGLIGVEWPNFFNTLAAQSFVAFAGYAALGGLNLFRGPVADAAIKPIEPFNRDQKITLAVIAALIVSVIVWRVDVGMASFVAAVLLSSLGAAEEDKAVKAMPWGVILMVCGVTVLIEILGKTGGLALFTGLLASVSHPDYINGIMAFVTGIVSVYASSSGVVMPAFLPTVPGLVAQLGGGNPLMIAYSINVGAHLVDVSPLSTIGALCLANAAITEDRRLLFRKLMIWGWSMAVVGAVVCQLFFGYR